jgi:Flp pilus assembly pilin Flp
MLKQKLLNPLASDETGVTAIEFAIIAPVFFMLMMGTFDFGHQFYMESVLRGAVNKAGRDSALESGAEATKQAAIDKFVKTQIYDVASSATVKIDRKYFRSYNDAAAPTHEDFIDGNSNNICDTGETYSDENHNGKYDKTGTADGQGGARDVVIYSVDVSYKHLFPVTGFIPGLSDTVNMNASTVLTNQPFSSQAVVVTGTCS